jgi:DNA primase
MNENEKSAPLTKAEIQRILEKDRVLIERVERRRAETARVVRDFKEAERRIIKIIRQLART